MKKEKFPKLLYVSQDRDGNQTYEIAVRSLNDMVHGQSVGIYKLQEAGTCHVTFRGKAAVPRRQKSK